jgi:hypothetical protein
LGTGPQGNAWAALGGQMEAMWEKAIPGLAVRQSAGAGRAKDLGRRALRISNRAINKQTISALRCIAK